MDRYAIVIIERRRICRVAQQWLRIDRARQFVKSFGEMTEGTGSFAAIVDHTTADALKKELGAP